LCLSVQPDIALVLSTDAGKRCSISSFQTNTRVVRTTEVTTRSGDGLQSSFGIDVLDRVAEVTRGITSVPCTVSFSPCLGTWIIITSNHKVSTVETSSLRVDQVSVGVSCSSQLGTISMSCYFILEPYHSIRVNTWAIDRSSPAFHTIRNSNDCCDIISSGWQVS
jgi:hypothetical protein